MLSFILDRMSKKQATASPKPDFVQLLVTNLLRLGGNVVTEMKKVCRFSHETVLLLAGVLRVKQGKAKVGIGKYLGKRPTLERL